MDVCLKDSGKTKNDIKSVVLVGGSTRVPKVREIVENWIGSREKVNC